MKQGKGLLLWMSFCILFGVLHPFALGQEELLRIHITRCVRPNIVVANVEREGRVERVRVKLAGIRVPFENPEIYQQALSRLRTLVEGKDVDFDFALGFSPEEHPWVGYLYVKKNLEEPFIVNAVLIREGLATLDEKTAGRNLLGYLLSMQEKAQQDNLGVWKKTQEKTRTREEECPSCVIRALASSDQEVPRESHNTPEGQEESLASLRNEPKEKHPRPFSPGTQGPESAREFQHERGVPKD